MLLLLSPAKTLNFDPTGIKKYTQPQFLARSEALVNTLKKYSSKQIQDLMGVSEKIADLNVSRYQGFSLPFDSSNAKQAILAFKGDVYQGLSVEDFDEAELNFAHEHIGILSGLYGLLRPLDLMQAYRLEMGTKLKVAEHKNLYEFWDHSITKQLNATGVKDIINLASNEYFKSVKKEALEGNLWTVDFKENKNGKYKIVAFYAKRARGMMCNYVVKNRLEKPEEMKGFGRNDYQFNEELSSERHYVFTR
jgi:cytoplasmic iron level regulating protein YaaA (DUF328/UPF0246 family)